MFPHELDRLRLIEVLVRFERVANRVNQKDVAYWASVGQGTISNLENLGQALDQPSRRVSREELIKVMVWGFGAQAKREFSKERMDVLLWLLDGQPLNGQEIKRLVTGYYPEATPVEPGAGTERAFRKELIKWIADAAAWYNNDQGSAANVEVFLANPASSVRGIERFEEMGAIKGHQIFITRWPLFVTLSQEQHESEDRQLDYYNKYSIPEREKTLESSARRIDNFVSQLPVYGSRFIHSLQAVEAYAAANPPGYRMAEHHSYRLGHLMNMVRLLEEFEGKFEVALVKKLPEIEIDLKSCKKLMIGGRRGEPDPPDWGPQWFHFSEDHVVLACLADFESHWDEVQLDEENVVGHDVIDRLNKLIEDNRD